MTTTFHFDFMEKYCIGAPGEHLYFDEWIPLDKNVKYDDFGVYLIAKSSKKPVGLAIDDIIYVGCSNRGIGGVKRRAATFRYGAKGAKVSHSAASNAVGLQEDHLWISIAYCNGFGKFEIKSIEAQILEDIEINHPQTKLLNSY